MHKGVIISYSKKRGMHEKEDERKLLKQMMEQTRTSGVGQQGNEAKTSCRNDKNKYLY